MTKIVLFISVFVSFTAHADPLTKAQMEKVRRELEKSGPLPKQTEIVTAEQVCAKWNSEHQINPALRERETVEARQAVGEVLSQLAKEARNNPKREYGALHLATMFQNFNGVRVFHDFQNNRPVQGDLYRDTDFYLPSCGIAVLNKGYLFDEPERRANILVHVFLGAAGYEDNDYQLTIALRLAERKLRRDAKLAKFNVEAVFPQSKDELSRRPVQQKVEQRPGRSQQTMIAGRGGLTGSGGGGDSTAAWIKMELLSWHQDMAQYAQKNGLRCYPAWANDVAFIKEVMNLKIEKFGDMVQYVAYVEGKYYVRPLNAYSTGSSSRKGTYEDNPAVKIVTGILIHSCNNR